MITIDNPIVQVRFKDDNGFTDAINLPLEEYKSIKRGQLETLAQQRVENFKTFVEEQSKRETPEPTKAELEEQLSQLDFVREELVSQLSTKMVKNGK